MLSTTFERASTPFAGPSQKIRGMCDQIDIKAPARLKGKAAGQHHAIHAADDLGPGRTALLGRLLATNELLVTFAGAQKQPSCLERGQVEALSQTC